MTHFPPLNIVITGPESTGKTHLAKQLAKRYNTLWSPEYARSYLNTLKNPYKEDDIITIAKGQLAQHKEDLKKVDNLLFSDTGLVVLKIWSDYKYGRCNPWIIEELSKETHTFYLLCQPDIPWVADPLRENPNDRHQLFSLFKTTLQGHNLPFAEVYGEGDIRLKKAIEIIDDYYKKYSTLPHAL